MFKRLRNLAIALFLSGTMVGCATTSGPTSGFVAGKIPVATAPSQASIAETQRVIRQELGRKQGMALSTSGPDYQRVNNLVHRLSRAAGLGNFSYPVMIADAGKKVNAMAVNGSVIVVYKELLRRVPNDSELAAVVGHEVAHIINKHHADNTVQKRAVIVGVGAAILGGLAGARWGSDAGDLAQKAAGTVGQGFYVNSYSREMEYEADHTGMMLMAKAGYNPQGAISFWSNANRIFGGTGGGSEFLSSHPSEGHRLSRLREALPQAQRYYRR